jgi:ADP-ribose pyrophosphatase YjhB (NUDIX family)
MTIFINDKPIELVDCITKARINNECDYDTVLDLRLDIVKESHFSGHVLMINAGAISLEKVFKNLHEGKKANLLSVTIVMEDMEVGKAKIKEMYKVIKAAGGVVYKKDHILLIHRAGKWDLPKGKLDDGEKSKVAALREVEEETGVVAQLGDRLCVTYHTYSQQDKMILKKTKWYKMYCIDDKGLCPQTEEDIQALAWMDSDEVKQAMTNTYSSIRWVLDHLKS